MKNFIFVMAFSLLLQAAGWAGPVYTVDINKENISINDGGRELNVSDISMIETEVTPRSVTYSVKGTVENTGPRGEVYIKIIARNKDGYEIKSCWFNGIMGQGDTRIMTTQVSLTPKDHAQLGTWEVITINKFPK